MKCVIKDMGQNVLILFSTLKSYSSFIFFIFFFVCSSTVNSKEGIRHDIFTLRAVSEK